MFTNQEENQWFSEKITEFPKPQFFVLSETKLLKLRKAKGKIKIQKNSGLSISKEQLNNLKNCATSVTLLTVENLNLKRTDSKKMKTKI